MSSSTEHFEVLPIIAKELEVFLKSKDKPLNLQQLIDVGFEDKPLKDLRASLKDLSLNTEFWKGNEGLQQKLTYFLKNTDPSFNEKRVSLGSPAPQFKVEKVLNESKISLLTLQVRAMLEEKKNLLQENKLKEENKKIEEQKRQAALLASPLFKKLMPEHYSELTNEKESAVLAEINKAKQKVLELIENNKSLTDETDYQFVAMQSQASAILLRDMSAFKFFLPTESCIKDLESILITNHKDMDASFANYLEGMYFLIAQNNKLAESCFEDAFNDVGLKYDDSQVKKQIHAVSLSVKHSFRK